MRLKNYTKVQEHMQLINQIRIIKEQNQKLKKRIEKMENAMHQIYLSKKKYKCKYKQIKQKLDILETVYKNRSSQYFNLQSYQYHQNPHQNANSRQTQNIFSKKRKQFLKANQLKEDLTSNTLHTMPSLRRSELKSFTNKNKLFTDLKQSNAEFSKTKDVGKIFRFKSQQQRNHFNSSGSQIQNQRRDLPYQSHSKPGTQKNNHVSPSIHQTTEYYDGDANLKQLIRHLLYELQSSSRLKNEVSFQQKQDKILDSDLNVRQRLEQICSKLKQIETNQQIFIKKQSQKETITNITKIKNPKSLNRSASGGKLNASFLKTIEDIGKDLSEWKIDYFDIKR